MLAQPVRVEWASPPEEWMRPAALAFETAVFQCFGHAPIVNNPSALVIHINTFRESGRPATCVGEELEDLSSTQVELVSDPMSYVVPKEAALSTSWGRFLIRHGWMTKFQFTTLIAAVALITVSPGRQVLTFKDGRKSSQGHIVTQMGSVILLLLFVSSSLHTMSKGMVKICVWYFDWLAIAAFAALAETAWAWEVFDGVGTENMTTFKILISNCETIGRVAVHCVFALMDAWTVSIRAKACTLLVYDFCVIWLYVNSRWNVQWSEVPVDILWTARTTRKVIFLTAMSNIAVFGFKLLLPYICGYPCALLRSAFIGRVREPLMPDDMHSWPWNNIFPKQSVVQCQSEWTGTQAVARFSSVLSSTSVGCRFESQVADVTTTRHGVCSMNVASQTEHESVIEYDVGELQLSRPTPIQFENPFDL